jgi:hypothetical protein
MAAALGGFGKSGALRRRSAQQRSSELKRRHAPQDEANERRRDGLGDDGHAADQEVGDEQQLADIEHRTHRSPASVKRLATWTRCSLSPSRKRIRPYAAGAISSTASAPVTRSVGKYTWRWKAVRSGNRGPAALRPVAWQHPDRLIVHIVHRPHDLDARADFDGSTLHVARLRAWSGITGWRFESASAHRAKAPLVGALSFLTHVGAPGEELSWQRPLANGEPRVLEVVRAARGGVRTRPGARCLCRSASRPARAPGPTARWDRRGYAETSRSSRCS